MSVELDLLCLMISILISVPALSALDSVLRQRLSAIKVLITFTRFLNFSLLKNCKNKESTFAIQLVNLYCAILFFKCQNIEESQYCKRFCIGFYGNNWSGFIILLHTDVNLYMSSTLQSTLISNTFNQGARWCRG